MDYAKTRALAVTELRRATMRAAAGRVGADSTAPLRVVAARWESRAGVAQRLAPSTVKAYSGVLHRHVLPVIGDLPLREVRPSQVVDVLVIMDRSGLGAASQDHALQALRAVYRMAAADDPWLANPAAGVPAPRRVLTPKVVPTRGQVRAMLAGAPDPRTKALVAILAYTGMRIGEALSLRWSDWPQTGEGRLQIRATKTRRPRAVPVPAKLARHLRAWRRAQAAHQLAAPRWADEGWILASDVGTHWEVHNARTRFNRLANGHPRRGLPPICPGATPHSLRHCAATILLEEGVPMRVVADLLGHSSTRVTEDVYAHVSTRLSAQAATVLNQAVRGNAGPSDGTSRCFSRAKVAASSTVGSVAMMTGPGCVEQTLQLGRVPSDVDDGSRCTGRAS